MKFTAVRVPATNQNPGRFRWRPPQFAQSGWLNDSLEPHESMEHHQRNASILPALDCPMKIKRVDPHSSTFLARWTLPPSQ